MWQTFSADKGETWSQAEKTDLVAARASHSLFRLGDGRLLLTHNASKTVQTPLTMRISADGGKTWGESVVVADAPLPGQGEAAWSRQVSYPSVTAADAGTLVVVWGLAQHGIRVNGVAPGDILTETSRNAHDEMKGRGASGKYFPEAPLGRRGRPEEVGKAVLFLASDDSSYLTGETITVDGGFLIY